MEGVDHSSSGEAKARAESRIWLSMAEEGTELRFKRILRDFRPRYPFLWARRRYCFLEADELSDGC